MTKEIDFSDVTPNVVSLSQGLTFYSQNFDPSHSKTWALAWLAKNAPEQHERLKNEPERAFSNRGFVCRMLHRGYKGGPDLQTQLMNFFTTLPVTPKDRVERTPAPTARKVVKSNDAIMQIEDAVDDILSDRETRDITLPVDPKQLGECRDWIEKEVVEVSEQIEKFRAILAVLESTYKKANGITEKLVKAKAKAPVEPTRAVAAQAVKTVTFLKEFPELGLTSVSPAKIVGAKKVFVYQTKYKCGLVLVAKDGETLSISGSSVRNFDPEKSYIKTVRKPAEFFKSKNIFVELAAQNSKRYPATSHISNTMVIVGVE